MDGEVHKQLDDKASASYIIIESRWRCMGAPRQIFKKPLCISNLFMIKFGGKLFNTLNQNRKHGQKCSIKIPCFLIFFASNSGTVNTVQFNECLLNCAR